MFAATNVTALLRTELSCPRCLTARLFESGTTYQWADRYVCAQLCGYSGDGSLAAIDNAPELDVAHSYLPRVDNLQERQTGARSFKARIFEHSRQWSIGQSDGVRTVEFQFLAKRITPRETSQCDWRVEALFGLDDLVSTAGLGGKTRRASAAYMREAIVNAISAVLECEPSMVFGVKKAITRYVNPAN